MAPGIPSARGIWPALSPLDAPVRTVKSRLPAWSLHTICLGDFETGLLPMHTLPTSVHPHLVPITQGLPTPHCPPTERGGGCTLAFSFSTVLPFQSSPPPQVQLPTLQDRRPSTVLKNTSQGRKGSEVPSCHRSQRPELRVFCASRGCCLQCEEHTSPLRPRGMLAVSLVVVGRRRSHHTQGPAAARHPAQPFAEKNYNSGSVLIVMKQRPREGNTLAQGHTVHQGPSWVTLSLPVHFFITYGMPVCWALGCQPLGFLGLRG